jgi:hypothetical protein
MPPVVNLFRDFALSRFRDRPIQDKSCHNTFLLVRDPGWRVMHVGCLIMCLMLALSAFSELSLRISQELERFRR